MLGLMTCIYVVAVLELNEDERCTVGEKQLNGDAAIEDQTQMTSFEINLKDKRLVQVLKRTKGFLCFHASVKHLICIYGAC